MSGGPVLLAVPGGRAPRAVCDGRALLAVAPRAVCGGLLRIRLAAARRHARRVLG